MKENVKVLKKFPFILNQLNNCKSIDSYPNIVRCLRSLFVVTVAIAGAVDDVIAERLMGLTL